MFRTIAKILFPASMYDYLGYRRQRKERIFRKQGLTKIICGAYQIEAPDSHLLIDLQKSQPYKDICLGISAKYIMDKYPGATIVDVGANIGDTAAMVLTYASPHKLILIEGSDYYFDILVRNVSQLPGDIVCRKALLSSGNHGTSGSFVHWQEAPPHFMKRRREFACQPHDL